MAESGFGASRSLMLPDEEGVAAARPKFSLPEQQWHSIAALLHLTRRELQIVRRIFAVKKEAVIAKELGISAHTVHAHLKRLYYKLQVHDRSEMLIQVFAAYIFLQRGCPCQPAAGSRRR